MMEGLKQLIALIFMVAAIISVYVSMIFFSNDFSYMAISFTILICMIPPFMIIMEEE
jgi:hypothetical protein